MHWQEGCLKKSADYFFFFAELANLVVHLKCAGFRWSFNWFFSHLREQKCMLLPSLLKMVRPVPIETSLPQKVQMTISYIIPLRRSFLGLLFFRGFASLSVSRSMR